MAFEGFKLKPVRPIACPVPTQPISAQPFMTASTAALHCVLQCGKDDGKQEYIIRNNMKVNGRVLKDSLELR